MYRIGQTKDVYVYYPTVRDTEITTFEETLDNLLQRRRALARDMLCAMDLPLYFQTPVIT